jgi:hypothetical protein
MVGEPFERPFQGLGPALILLTHQTVDRCVGQQQQIASVIIEIDRGRCCTEQTARWMSSGWIEAWVGILEAAYRLGPQRPRRSLELQRQAVEDWPGLALGQQQDLTSRGVDRESLGVTRALRVAEVEDRDRSHGAGALVLRLLEQVERARFAARVVVAEVGDQQIGRAVEAEGREVLPVDVFRITEIAQSRVVSRRDTARPLVSGRTASVICPAKA